MDFRLLPMISAACFWLAGTSASANTGLADESAGALDRPQPSLTNGQTPDGATTLSIIPANTVVVENPEAAQAALREEVEEEQRELEQLDRGELEERAEQGERAAQVVLGADFAQEASMLSFAPAAANDALSDAARWYSLAASRGFPGAPSLDQAGIRFYPIRIQREQVR